MLLCKKIKIEVSSRDVEALEFMQAKCRGLYNWLVMRIHDGERWSFNEAKKSLQESKQYDPELRFVYGKLLAEVYFRLDRAMQDFFRRVKAGEKPGFPRVKPRHRFFTLCYPAMYLTVQGNTIILPTGGGQKWGPKRYENIKAHLTEEPPTHFRELAVSRDARGNYYCSFIYNDAEQPEKGEDKLDKRRKQRDCLHKASHLIAHRLAERAVVIGDLSQRQMVMKKQEHETPKDKRKRRIRNRLVYNDWGLYSFMQMLAYKCLRFGKELYIISERGTTKTCHVCQHKQEMPLYVRTYRCENCGLVMDRDENSAVNIYKRFLAGPPPHTSAR